MKYYLFLFTLIALLWSNKLFAYDIAVENADGVTIYYNYINDGKELEVTASSFKYLGYDGTFYNEYKSGVTASKLLRYSSSYMSSNRIVIPSEVVFMGRTRKVTAIGECAFISLQYKEKMYGKKNFSYIYIPSTINKIGKSAFAVYTVMQLEKGVVVYGSYSDLYNIKTVVIEDIGDWCKIDFGNATANPIHQSSNIYTNDENEVTNLVIPEGVTSISPYAFYNCSCIKTLTFPSSVTSIGTSAFEECNGLVSITIPNSVTSIGNSAFSKSSLISVTIPNSVTRIENSVFFGCNGLTSITIPSSVTSIGELAFCGCSSLTSLTIPNSVTIIGREAFKNCNGLSFVIIGGGVTILGSQALYCNNLTTVESHIQVPFEISSTVFSKNTIMNASLYVPKGTIDKYKSTEGWKDFVFIEELPNETGMQSIDYENEIYDIHSLRGNKLTNPSKGINIIKMKDGTVKKVLVK